MRIGPHKAVAFLRGGQHDGVMEAQEGTTAESLAALLPAGFILGVASAAFQIEGSLDVDGRGPSSWDAFAEKPGAISDGGSPAIACDHYNRSGEDIALMRELGVDSYRFSLSWPRIQPDGKGAPNEQGLDFYDRLVDKLLAAGISPMVTLFHWDTPLALEHDGGWLSRDTAGRFADYAAVAASRLGDRVAQWVTLNEPVTVALEGYGLGVHAPGHQLLFDALPAVHHQLLGHGMAVQALRAAGVAGRIGVANMHAPVSPAGSGYRDGLMAATFDLLVNRVYADPLLTGSYPAPPLLVRPWFKPLSNASDADMALIHQPLDFYGVNYYYPVKVAAGGGTRSTPAGDSDVMAKLPFHLVPFPEFKTTGFGWPVAPEYLGSLLRELKERYGQALPPVVITESGASFPEPAHVSGTFRDQARIDYLATHLEQALRATAPGGTAHDVELQGYYVWTLLDNFEWAAGYTQRFGLVHVDFDSLKRTPKESFYWYRALCSARTPLPPAQAP